MEFSCNFALHSHISGLPRGSRYGKVLGSASASGCSYHRTNSSLLWLCQRWSRKGSRRNLSVSYDPQDSSSVTHTAAESSTDLLSGYQKATASYQQKKRAGQQSPF
ncbi:hypothetical protein MHYP_G00355670 [Metynnis hypsauchen]